MTYTIHYLTYNINDIARKIETITEGMLLEPSKWLGLPHFMREGGLLVTPLFPHPFPRQMVGSLPHGAHPFINS